MTGNVFVTPTNPADYVTIKYNAQGNQLWLSTYNGPGNYFDIPYGLTVDSDGNVYVTGESWGVGPLTALGVGAVARYMIMPRSSMILTEERCG